MEVKHVLESLFVPLMLRKDNFKNNKFYVAVNNEHMMNCGLWKQSKTGLSYIPNLMRIELTFDGDISDPKFDLYSNDIYSIIGTKPHLLYESGSLTYDQNTNSMKNIINCYSGKLITVPHELDIYTNLLTNNWSYRYVLDSYIYVFIDNGCLTFDSDFDMEKHVDDTI